MNMLPSAARVSDSFPESMLALNSKWAKDALYFRVSSNRQTAENQFEDLVQAAERGDPPRDWVRIRSLLAKVVEEEQRPTASRGIRTIYKVNPEIAQELVELCIYVEQGAVGLWPQPS